MTRKSLAGTGWRASRRCSSGGCPRAIHIHTGPRRRMARQGRTATARLANEEERRVAQFAMMNIALSCRRLGRRAALRLPVELRWRDEVILVHRRRRVIFFGFLQSNEESIDLRSGQVETPSLWSGRRASDQCPRPTKISSRVYCEWIVNGPERFASRPAWAAGAWRGSSVRSPEDRQPPPGSAQPSSASSTDQPRL